MLHTSSHLINFSPSCKALGTSIGLIDTLADLLAVVILNNKQLYGNHNTIVDKNQHLPPKTQI